MHHLQTKRGVYDLNVGGTSHLYQLYLHDNVSASMQLYILYVLYCFYCVFYQSGSVIDLKPLYVSHCHVSACSINVCGWM